MCGRKSRWFCAFLAVCFLACSSPCFADVVLTDEEASEMMDEMEKSEKLLEDLKTKSIQTQESYEKKLSEMERSYEEKLTNVETTYAELNKNWQEQLKEEKRKRILPWTVAGISVTGCIVLSVISIATAVNR